VSLETLAANATGLVKVTEKEVEEMVVTEMPVVTPIASKVPALFPIIASTDEEL
jgi:hypothetical protein